jgi:hypothetical protein
MSIALTMFRSEMDEMTEGIANLRRCSTHSNELVDVKEEQQDSLKRRV